MRSLWQFFVSNFLLRCTYRFIGIRFVANDIRIFWPGATSSTGRFRHRPCTTTRSSLRRSTARFSSCDLHLWYRSFAPTSIAMFAIVPRIRTTSRTSSFLWSWSSWSRSHPCCRFRSWLWSSSSFFRTWSTFASTSSSTSRSRSSFQFRSWSWFRSRFVPWFWSWFRTRSWSRGFRSWFWPRSRSWSWSRSTTTSWPWTSIIESAIILTY